MTVRVRSPKSGYPSAEEVDAAVLEAMGGRSYVESGRRFKAQAGEPLGLAQFNVAEAYQRGEAGYDDKARAYVFNVAPNQRFIAALNTWLKTGSVDAARAVDRQIAAADEKFDREYAEALRKAQAERGVLDAIGTGPDETAAKAAQALHNVSSFGRGAVVGAFQERNSPEMQRMVDEDRKAQEMGDAAEPAIPEETTAAKKFARGATQVVGDIATKGGWVRLSRSASSRRTLTAADGGDEDRGPDCADGDRGSAVGKLTGKLSPAAPGDNSRLGRGD